MRPYRKHRPGRPSKPSEEDGERLKKNDSDTLWYCQNFLSCTELTRANARCVTSVTTPEELSTFGTNICTSEPSFTHWLTDSSIF